jgi:hypothetical protein
MKEQRLSYQLGVVVVSALCGWLVGCSDVGDSSAIPVTPDAGDATMSMEDGALSDDAGESSSEATPPGASSDDAQDTSTTSSEDSGSNQQAMPEGSTGPDVGPTDVPDTGATAGEAAAPDVFVEGAADTGVDATMSESGPDAGGTDASDAAEDVVADTSEHEAESGTDGGSGVPCTAAGQTNCVKCDQSIAGNNVCTPTEALVVERDIAKGFISGSRPDMTTSCYECLASAGCFDDTMGDTGNECGDLTGTVGGGAQATETKTEACLNTLACVLGAPSQGGYTFPGGYASCADSPLSGIANCYCGPAFPTTVLCGSASGATVNGVCEQVMLDGFGDTTATSSSTIIQVITTPTSGSGMADALMKCAGTNATTPACPMCYQ